MTQRILFFICTIAPLFSFCQKPGKLHLIPEPVETTLGNGVFALTNATQIIYPADEPDFELAAQYLQGMLGPSTGYNLQMVAVKSKSRQSNKGNAIVFEKNDKVIKHPEGYILEAKSGGIIIKAANGAGAFYAVQTLRQLFPAEISANTPQKDIAWNARCCSITDYPRFEYRGLHLDVARHWFPVVFVKRYIDLLAMHKMNRFHWHLTDDQGWRIEIKRFPKLQAFAACREETLEGHYTDQPPHYDGVQYCHFYTQEEVKDIVEYARKRFVTIIPEIEMPGHAMAALAAYPELGCDGSGYQTATTWGVFDDVYCAGNDAVFAFQEAVIDEVAPLFPGPYFHVGGDECPKTKWKECSRCQDRMKKEGLKDEHELQSYFIKRAEKMLAKHGKKLIGWDEILEGGLSPNATVMSWRGVEGGITAAKEGHDVVMTPGSHCYLDHYQSDPNTEPIAIGGFLPLEKVYSYEPVPEELTAEQAKHILGVQGNMWTEYVQSPAYLDYMVYPRACALSEVAWSPKASRQLDDFQRRLLQHFNRLDAMKVNYAKSIFDIKPTFEKNQVNLTCSDPSVQIRYTLDGSKPVFESSLYQAPFKIEKNTTVKASAWRGQTELGKVKSVVYMVHKASGKPYTISKTPTQYNGGETYGLTNGVNGGIKTWGDWVGLVNRDIDPVIDLGEKTTINRVITHYMNNKQSWIHPPKSIEILVSDDGKNFRSVGKKLINTEEKMNNSIETITITTPKTQARYVKLIAETTGVIPKQYPGAGEGAWLFIDEVIVE